MKIPIRIISPKKLKVLWQITTACTYSCSYCPKELHTGTNNHINLEELDQFLNQLEGRDYIVNFTGGEPTIHPQYIDIIKKLQERNIRIISDTNISRTDRFYKEASQYVDNWCASIHPSMFTWDEDKIRTLADNSFTVVYLMMDPNFWNLALDYLERLKKIPRIKIIVVKCLSNWSGSGWYGSYTNEQQDFLNNSRPIYTFTKEEADILEQKYSWLKEQTSKVVWNDQTVSDLAPDQLMIEDLHKFQGWNCEVGNEVITIDHSCNISLGTCGTRHLGHWSKFNTSLMFEGIICPREYCHCGVDIKTTKYKL